MRFMGSMVDFGLHYRTFISHSHLRDLLECFHSRFLLHYRPITNHSYFRPNGHTPPTNPKRPIEGRSGVKPG